MKLEPIVMIHGGLISDTTPMSMSQACSTAPPIVPPSQKTIQRTGTSATCRASFIAGPKGRVPKYTLERLQLKRGKDWSQFEQSAATVWPRRGCDLRVRYGETIRGKLWPSS